jgi:plasmid stabilization system protein ParE
MSKKATPSQFFLFRINWELQRQEIWTQPAEADLDNIIDAIAKDAPLRAVDFGRRLQELAGSLRWNPHRCHLTGTEL